MKKKNNTFLSAVALIPTVILAPSSFAAVVVLQEDFSGAVATASGAEHTFNDPSIASNALFTGNNITVDGGAGTVLIRNNATQNSRGVLFFFDISGLSAGDYRINYDIVTSDLTFDDPAVPNGFGQLFAVSGIDGTGAFTFDLNEGTTSFVPGLDVPNGNNAGNNGNNLNGVNGATFSQLGSNVAFPGAAGIATGDFTLAANGQAGDFLGVALIRAGSIGDGNFTATGVTIETVPEPSSALLGCFGSLVLLARRRR